MKTDFDKSLFHAFIAPSSAGSHVVDAELILYPGDINKYDLFVCMEDANVRNVSYIFEDKDNKVIKLLDRNISDPWYTGNFLSTYNDLVEGIDILIERVK